MVGAACVIMRVIMITVGTSVITVGTSVIATRTLHRLLHLLLTDRTLGLTETENGLADVVLSIRII